MAEDWAEEMAMSISTNELCYDADWRDVMRILREAYAKGRDEGASDFTSGKLAVIPQTKEHAERLYTVAVACLKGFDFDPEAAITRKAKADGVRHMAGLFQDTGQYAMAANALLLAQAIEDGKS